MRRRKRAARAEALATQQAVRRALLTPSPYFRITEGQRQYLCQVLRRERGR